MNLGNQETKESQESWQGSHGENSAPLIFQRAQIEQLLAGYMPINVAMDFLRQTSEKNLDPLSIKLFVDILSEFMIAEAGSFAQIKNALDCCGTGGSGRPHYNTSTTVAFILAAAGVPTAKFGNRAANSLSGSFDFLERIGLGGNTDVKALPELFEQTNLVFIFAQQFYPALATIAPVRQALGARTIFNLIGPLLNPAKPRLRLLGTPNERAQELIAGYLATESHLAQAYVVRSANGLDELEIAAINHITSVNQQGTLRQEFSLGEENYDRPGWAISADECASIFLQLINHEVEDSNYFFRTVCLNAAAGLMVAGQAASIDEGYEKATQLLKSGAVANKYEQYRSLHAGHSN